MFCLMGDDGVEEVGFSGEVYSAAMAASRCGRMSASSFLSDSSSARMASSGERTGLGLGTDTGAAGVGEGD